MFALKVSTAGLSNDSFENKTKKLTKNFFYLRFKFKFTKKY